MRRGPSGDGPNRRKETPLLPLERKTSLADKIAPVALVVGLLLVAADVVLAFTMAPLVKGAELSEPVVIAGQVITNKLLLSQKIFYLHVPVAIASFAAMFFTAFYGVRFLMTKDRRYDLRARVVTGVVLAFIVATMVSGDLWTRFEWGVWWTWEPRLTTYFILMLLVIGYFILRNAIDDPERRATFAAVFGIVAFIDAPISFMVTRLIPSSTHPVVFRTDSGLPPAMLVPFLLGLFGMLMVAFALYRLALSVNESAQEVEDLKERLEEQDASRAVAAAEEARRRLAVAAEGVARAGADAAGQADADAASGSDDAGCEEAALDGGEKGGSYGSSASSGSRASSVAPSGSADSSVR